jgi:hypothetical protein
MQTESPPPYIIHKCTSLFIKLSMLGKGNARPINPRINYPGTYGHEIDCASGTPPSNVRNRVLVLTPQRAAGPQESLDGRGQPPLFLLHRPGLPPFPVRPEIAAAARIYPDNDRSGSAGFPSGAGRQGRRREDAIQTDGGRGVYGGAKGPPPWRSG